MQLYDDDDPESGSTGPSHVILTVRIYGVFDGSPKTVYWYHVPRLGDRVEVTVAPDVVFQGPVEAVIWSDSHVEVWLGGK